MVSDPSFFLFKYAAFIHSSTFLPVIHLFSDCFFVTHVYCGLLNPAVSSNSRREAVLTHTDAQKNTRVQTQATDELHVKECFFFLLSI